MPAQADVKASSTKAQSATVSASATSTTTAAAVKKSSPSSAGGGAAAAAAAAAAAVAASESAIRDARREPKSPGRESVQSAPPPPPPPPPPGSLEEIEVLFVKPLEQKYECPVCSQVLRYPMQFPQCGHRCCSACLPELLRVSPRCPLDQSGIEKDRVLEDRAFQTETEALVVKCSFTARGCKWTGALVDLMSHLESCDRGLTVCPLNCGIVFEKRFQQKHGQQDCAKRPADCRLCAKKMLAEDQPEHAAVCTKAPVQCPNACDQQRGLLREGLIQHLAKDCPRQSAACPLSQHGCDFSGQKKDVQHHMQEKQAWHTELLCTAFKAARQQLDDKEKHSADLEEKVAGLEKRIRSMECVYGPQMIWRIDGYADKLADATSGRKCTIYSSPFLSHRHGYKLAVSACLFGDGAARGKYMSVFLCVCKSDNDPLLQWPFGHRVTFELLDQRDEASVRRNVSYSFKPNLCEENRPFLDRPIGDRNPSFGSVRFADLDVLNSLQFVKDDVIFIKVIIDCEGIKPL